MTHRLKKMEERTFQDGACQVRSVGHAKVGR